MNDVNVIVLVRGEHRWIWLYEDSQRHELLRRLGRLASNPDSGFTWQDVAAVYAKVVKEGSKYDVD